ncbi:MAG: VanZ family protein [Vicingus serpentipes]|nr:VanZ family protein [Vicingus serpentipes]
MKSFFPAIVWAIIIFLLSAFPGNKIPDIPVWNIDKLVHIGMYAVFSFLLLTAYNPQYSTKKTRYFTISLIAFFSVFYGGVMEILQHYIFINRSGSMYDFIANTIGSVMGVFIQPYVIKWLPLNKWWN